MKYRKFTSFVLAVTIVLGVFAVCSIIPDESKVYAIGESWFGFLDDMVYESTVLPPDGVFTTDGGTYNTGTSGSISYCRSTGTVTMDSISLDVSGLTLDPVFETSEPFSGNLTFVVLGECFVECDGKTFAEFHTDVKIMGPGKLTIANAERGFAAYDSLHIVGANLNIVTSDYEAMGSIGNITIEDSDIYAEVTSNNWPAIISNNNVAIKYSNVEVYNKSAGVAYITGGSIEVSDYETILAGDTKAEAAPLSLADFKASFAEGLDPTYIYSNNYIKITAKVPVVPAEEVPEPVVIFKDVDHGTYYRNAVYWLYYKGAVEGKDVPYFRPTDDCTRAQMITFLWKSKGSPKASITSLPFKDVDEDAYYYEALLWAYEHHFAFGMSDDEFGPELTVTRGQAMCFISRIGGLTKKYYGKNPFTDVKAGAYYEDAVKWGYAKGVTSGTSETTFSPNETCMRCDIACFIFNYFGK